MKRAELYQSLGQSRDGEWLSVWRWRLVAANGEIIANGGQGFSRRIDCLRSLCVAEGAEFPLIARGESEFLLRHPTTGDLIAEGVIIRA